MKIKAFALSVIAGAALVACGEAPETVEVKKEEKIEAPVETAMKLMVNTTESTVWWEGHKLAYGHHGLINITEGNLDVEGKNIVGGTFVVDMNTIAELDNEDPETAQQLAGHLMSPDFFDAAAYPTAKFEIASVTAEAMEGSTHKITGNLTIKDKTNSISFPAMVTMGEGEVNAKAEFSIDRNDWGVNYGSASVIGDIADKVIADEITFKVNLVAKK